MELEAVSKTYRRWAPIYDSTFGRITGRGRRRAVEFLNDRSGRLLEVGVGTGLSLAHYRPHLEVTGIDFSHEMLACARAKVAAERLSHVKELRQMDARQLDFADESFDTVVAMHFVSVVPEPERAVAEMARVCRPGGEVVILNHFARERGILAAVERAAAPFANILGWHSDFSMDCVQGDARLEVEEHLSYPPLGMFTLLRLRRRAEHTSQ